MIAYGKVKKGGGSKKIKRWAMLEKSDKSKKIAERQKRQHRKDEKLVDVVRERANTHPSQYSISIQRSRRHPSEKACRHAWHAGAHSHPHTQA